MNTNEAVARILKIEGIEWISCYPSNILIEAVAKEGIRPIMFRHERGAIMAADGYSRTSDRQRFGVVITQAQAGAENSMGGIAQAYADNIPILWLPAGPPMNQVSVRPNFSAIQNYRGVTKVAESITRPDQVANIMRRAFHALRNGRPGPVVIDIPADVGPESVPDLAFNYHSPKAFLQVPSFDDVRDAVKALLEAKNPVIWSGAGVLFSGATSELKELAELMEIPVFCTMPGKSSFDERHPLSLGAGSGATTLAAHKWLQECDLVFALGSSLTRTSYGQSIPPGKIIIQNTDSIDDINKDESINIGLPGDCRLTLKMIIAEIKSKLGNNGQKERVNIATDISEVKHKWMEEWSPLLSSEELPINAYRVIGDINRTLDWENSIVTHDAGAPRDSIIPFYTATVPHSYVGWGKTTHLGFGIPLMIGAKLAHPDKFCLNLMGDGAFGMSGLDIETSVRSGTPITTVVLNNGGMATYPGGYPVARERYGVTYMSSDYAKIAEGMGAVGITVKRPNEIVSALKDAQKLNAEGQTVLIDVHSNMEARRSQW